MWKKGTSNKGNWDLLWRKMISREKLFEIRNKSGTLVWLLQGVFFHGQHSGHFLPWSTIRSFSSMVNNQVVFFHGQQSGCFLPWSTLRSFSSMVNNQVVFFHGQQSGCFLPWSTIRSFSSMVNNQVVFFHGQQSGCFLPWSQAGRTILPVLCEWPVVTIIQVT